MDRSANLRAVVASALSDLPPELYRPLKRSEFDELACHGSFEDERVELLYGSVVRMTPIGPPHDSTVQRLTRLLLRALDPRAAVRIQSSFAASDRSEPVPDVALVPPGDYDDEHPNVAWLIIEVADSSLIKDRGVKARLYAESGVVEYWIVNLVDRQVEVHSDIVRGAYTRVVPYRSGEHVVLTRFPDVQIAVDEIIK